MFNVIRNIVIVGFFLISAYPVHAKMVDEDTVSVSATVAQDNIIIFSGDACPSCQVFLLMEGSIVDSTISQGNGSFQLDMEDVELVTHQFGVYAVDKDGTHSGTSSVSVDVSQGAIIYVSDILVIPTLKVGDSEVEQGTNVILSGYTVPKGGVTIEIDSANIVIQASSAEGGGFYYSLDTSNLQIGSHWATAKVKTATDTSGYSETVHFDVVVAAQEEEEEEDEIKEKKTTKNSTVETSKLTIEQQIEQITQRPPTDKAIDFAVVVANENSQVSSGEFLELYVTFINVPDELMGKKAEFIFNIMDPSNDELYRESYGLTLNEALRLQKKIKIPCSAIEGGYLAGAEIAIDQQRFIENASFQVSRGNLCPKEQTGLETRLVSQNIRLISFREYVDLLVALIAGLLIIVFILLNKVHSRKKDEQMMLNDRDREKQTRKDKF